MLFSGLTQIKALKTESAGSSFKYSAFHGEDHVIAKLSFYPLDSYYHTENYQIVEAQIYEHVLHHLHKHTPHLPKWYMTIRSEFDFKNSNLNISKWECPKKWNVNYAQSLIIEHIGSTDLFSIWSQIGDNPKVVFQVLYTIACFERVGLKHNDLHTGNIMICQLDNPITLSYEIQGKVISFQTKNLVKIIDYDRACIYSDKVERNGYLCDTSQYNGINNGIDVFKFLHNYKSTNGALKTWLTIVCPQLEFISGFNGLLPEYMNPRNYIGDTLDLITSLAQHFSSDFQFYYKFDKPFYKLPPDTSFKPIIDNTTFLCSKEIKPARPFTFNHQISQELLNLGYNWKLHCTKLFSDTVYDDISDENEEEIYKYCMWVTNPIKNSKPTKDLSNIVKFKPILSIPQKPYQPKQDQHKHKEYKHQEEHQEHQDKQEHEEEEEPEEEEEETEEEEEEPEEEPEEEDEQELTEDDKYYISQLPVKYQNTSKWHKRYSMQEIEETRRYLRQLALTYLPLSHLDDFYRIYKVFDGTKGYVRNIILETITLVREKAQTKRLKSILLYMMMAMLSRTLSYLRRDIKFFYTLEEKVLEFKKQNLDYSSLIDFDIPVVPKIEEILYTIL